MSKLIDIIGQQFNRLTVISYAKTKNGKAYWNCICICKTLVIVEGYKLRIGHTKSCGCYKLEIATKTGFNSRKILCKRNHDISILSARLPDGGCKECKRERRKSYGSRIPTEKSIKSHRNSSLKYAYSKKGLESRWRQYKAKLGRKILRDEQRIEILQLQLNTLERNILDAKKE